MALRKTASTRDITKRDVVDPKRKLEAKMWIQTVLGTVFDGDLFDELHDGTVLCQVLNEIQPGTCAKFKKSKIAFVCRNNISIFIKGARRLGVPETDIFETRDLFDKQRLSACVQTVYAVSAKSRKLGFPGPFIGVSYADANKRHFTKAQLAKSKSAVPLLTGGDLASHSRASSLDSYGIIKTDKAMQSPSAVQSTWSKGSINVSRSRMDSYGIVKTQKNMQTHSNVQSVWELGAKNVDTTTDMDSYGIVKTNKDMQNPSVVQSVWHTGSNQTDSSGKQDAYGIIKTTEKASSLNVLGVWQQGAKAVDSKSMDGYGIIKTNKDMQNPSQVQSVWEKGSLTVDSGTGQDSYGIVKTQDGAHSGVQSVWEKGANEIDTTVQDSYGIVKTKDESNVDSKEESVGVEGSDGESDNDD